MRSVTFAMTGALHRNGRAIRQIGLLEEIFDHIDVIAADAGRTEGVFGSRVALHAYELPVRPGLRFFWTLHRRVKQLAETLTTNVYHASDLYVLPALARVAKGRRATLVYDARELYPFVQGTVGRPWATFFWSQVEGRFVSAADLVMTVNDSIADRIEETYGIDRPIVIPNVPSHRSVVPSTYLRDHLDVPESDLIILHLGQMKQGRGCETLIRATEACRGVHTVFVGDGPDEPRLQALTRSLNVVDRVTFLPPVPYESVLNVTAGADVGVSLLEDTCLNHRLALPNKLFEYLHSGLPVIVSDFPELGRIVRQYDVGLTADPARSESVVQALETIRDQSELRARFKRNTVRVAEDFNWRSVGARMQVAYRAILE